MVYGNGWEYGSYEANTTSDNPSVCGRMVLARFGGGSVVGVRILGIDGERVDYLLLEEWIKDAEQEERRGEYGV